MGLDIILLELMTGAIIQLVARGAQDAYLTFNPEVTYFKIVYKRTTNFAIISTVQNFMTPPEFGGASVCRLAQMGDLLGKIWLHLRVPEIVGSGKELYSWHPYLGIFLVRECILNIAERMIERHPGEWYLIWGQLSGRFDDLKKLVGSSHDVTDYTHTKPSIEIYLPLLFWFSRDYSLALPLRQPVQLTFHFRMLEESLRMAPTHFFRVSEDFCAFLPGEILEQENKILGHFWDFDFINRTVYYSVEFADELQKDVAVRSFVDSNILVTPISTSQKIPLEYPHVSLGDARLYVEYILLDGEERHRLLKRDVHYLIEQLEVLEIVGNQQHLSLLITGGKPYKLLVWTVEYEGYPFVYQYNGESLTRSSKLLDLEMSWEYTNWIVPYERFSGNPDIGVNVYSFSLYPEKRQPSGFYKIQNHRLDVAINARLPLRPVRLKCFLVYYNILRITNDHHFYYLWP